VSGCCEAPCIITAPLIPSLIPPATWRPAARNGVRSPETLPILTYLADKTVFLKARKSMAQPSGLGGTLWRSGEWSFLTGRICETRLTATHDHGSLPMAAPARRSRRPDRLECGGVSPSHQPGDTAAEDRLGTCKSRTTWACHYNVVREFSIEDIPAEGGIREGQYWATCYGGWD
jgi:hypothetical protein